MYGRYGIDQFSRAIVITGLALSLIASLTKNSLLIFIAYIPIIYAFYRILSKNIQKRTRENFIYCDLIRKTKAKLNNYKLLLIGTRTHKYYKCKKCRQIIRIPRGKGKICISCPKCRNEFISRT
jgi:hypothetical protein